MIRFVTLFPDCPNFGIAKDVGQIPYTLGKQYDDISAKLVSYAIDPNGDYLDQAPGLTIEACPNIRNNAFLSGLVYLIRNAKNIDWLNIYHARSQSLVWMRVYKLLNPKGKVYLKMDAGFETCDDLDTNSKKRKVFEDCTKLADLVSVESLAVKERLCSYASRELILVHNGYCNTGTSFDVTTPRQNTFLTVGRLGTKQKATEVLLEAYASTAAQHNWTLQLIGPVNTEFEPEIARFFQTHPQLESRVSFLGSVTNRDALNTYYRSAKVFVLPSRWEGSPLVVSEALSCGCRTILSEQVPPYWEFTANGKYGSVVPADDVRALAQALLQATQEAYTPELASQISAYANQEFSWINICAQLKKSIN